MILPEYLKSVKFNNEIFESLVNQLNKDLQMTGFSELEMLGKELNLLTIETELLKSIAEKHHSVTELRNLMYRVDVSETRISELELGFDAADLTKLVLERVCIKVMTRYLFSNS